MKLWKITHHRRRVLPGATVHLLPCAIKPTEADAARQLEIDLGENESICIEDTRFDVVLPNSNLPVPSASKPRPRSLIFVSGGVVTDVFSTERAMDVSILDTQDLKSIGFMLQTVDEAIEADTAGLYRHL